MPHMADLQDEYKAAGVTFIGLSTKDPNNTFEKVAAFVKKRGPKLGYTFAYAEDKTSDAAWMKAAGRNGIPCTFVVGKDGKIAYIGHPMYLDVVLPKVVAGTWSQADADGMETIEAALSAMSRKLSGADAAAGLKALADFEAEYPKLAGIVYFDAPKLRAMLKLEKYDEVKTTTAKLIGKAVTRNDSSVLRSMSVLMRSPAAKGQKPLLELSLQAADELLKLNGEADFVALMNASEAHAAAGNEAKATAFAKKAIPIAEKELKDEKDVSGLLRLADAHWAAGDKPKAKETAEKAVANAPATMKRFAEMQAKKFGVEPAKNDDKNEEKNDK